jgi:hypothetical protein
MATIINNVNNINERVYLRIFSQLALLLKSFHVEQ